MGKKSTLRYDEIGLARSKNIVRDQVLNLPFQAVLNCLILTEISSSSSNYKGFLLTCWVQISNIHSLQQERNKQICTK